MNIEEQFNQIERFAMNFAEFTSSYDYYGNNIWMKDDPADEENSNKQLTTFQLWQMFLQKYVDSKIKL
jgi:hypothetical protein